jgi:hypothetical protein
MLVIKQQNVTNGTLWFWVGWSANAQYKTTECYKVLHRVLYFIKNLKSVELC